MKRIKIAVILLDFILIMMTATWLLASIYKGMSKLDLWYNFIYVTLNIMTLILNLLLIKNEKDN